MTTTTILPAEGQVTDLLDSPMTPSEKARRIEIEATCSGQTLARAKGLLSIYQDRLFRGDNGGCTWGEYLQNDVCRLGYSELDTTNASNELNWCVLCIAVAKWNAENPLLLTSLLLLHLRFGKQPALSQVTFQQWLSPDPLVPLRVIKV